MGHQARQGLGGKAGGSAIRTIFHHIHVTGYGKGKRQKKEQRLRQASEVRAQRQREVARVAVVVVEKRAVGRELGVIDLVEQVVDVQLQRQRGIDAVGNQRVKKRITTLVGG
ncbi:hypothetical protein D3C71_1849480 [compost metagenome]